jgi:hypothetical protein
MNFVTPSAEDLAELRADPLVFEQELDVRPDVAEALERALGFRAGRRYWRSAAGTLYALELGDFGRGRPSMALVYGFWPRWEPRPISERAITQDLETLCLWVAEVTDSLNVEDVRRTFDYAWASQAGGG